MPVTIRIENFTPAGVSNSETVSSNASFASIKKALGPFGGMIVPSMGVIMDGLKKSAPVELRNKDGQLRYRISIVDFSL